MSCAPPTITVGGVTISTSDFQNAKDLIDLVSGDGGDPTLDGYDENIAGGNNTSGRRGVQLGSISTQTSLPSSIAHSSSMTDMTPAKGGNGSPIPATIWNRNYDYLLSTNFTVKSLTVGTLFPNQLSNYMSYTQDARFCNLQNLSVNILEPLLAKFGKITVNSGIRNATSTPSGVSQHITGQACDIQVQGWTYARYWDAAIWIKNNIPFDQFIFEHSDKTGLAWFHLSYNKDGNRPVSAPTKVMTMYRNQYDAGLKRFG
jgi:hypothetical protein